MQAAATFEERIRSSAGSEKNYEGSVDGAVTVRERHCGVLIDKRGF